MIEKFQGSPLFFTIQRWPIPKVALEVQRWVLPRWGFDATTVGAREAEVALAAAARWWISGDTLWWTNISYWKWPFIVDLPMKNGDFPLLC